jgi:iturin family lipopeptide synthetase A
VTITDLVGRLRLADVRLTAPDGRLVIDSSSGFADEQLISDLRQHERELIGELGQGSIPLVDRSGPAAIYHRRFAAAHERLADPSALNVTLRLDITGPLDCEALARAASALARRHQALRTGFRRYGDHLVQEVDPAQPVTLGLTALDTGGLPAGTRGEAVERWCLTQASTPFDLSDRSLIRFALAQCLPVQAGDEQWVLMIVQHHMITDATSTALLLADLAALYRAQVQECDAALPAPSAQQLDFARWEQARLTEDRTAELIGFWRTELDGALFTFPLSGEHPRPESRSEDGIHLNVYVPPDLSDRLARFARAQGVTLFAVLTAAFGTLLCELTRQDEVVITAPFHNRIAPQFETMIGEMANSLPVRLRSLPGERITDLIKRTGRQLWALADHQELPLPVILDALQISEHPGAEEFPMGFLALHPRTGQYLDLPGLRVAVADYAVPAAATADFGVLIVPEERRLRLWAEAASYLGARAVLGWLDRYIGLLERFVSQPMALARDW